MGGTIRGAAWPGQGAVVPAQRRAHRDQPAIHRLRVPFVASHWQPRAPVSKLHSLDQRVPHPIQRRTTMQTTSTTSRLMSFALAAMITLSVLMGLDTLAVTESAGPQMAKSTCVSTQA
jgi:hypothetical protein